MTEGETLTVAAIALFAALAASLCAAILDRRAWRKKQEAGTPMKPTISEKVDEFYQTARRLEALSKGEQ